MRTSGDTEFVQLIECRDNRGLDNRECTVVGIFPDLIFYLVALLYCFWYIVLQKWLFDWGQSKGGIG